MNLFWLSEQLIRRLRYVYKFLLIGLLIFIPMVVMSYMYQRQSSDLISFNAKERVGVEYIAPLQKLTAKLQQSRGLYHIYLSSKGAAVKEQIDNNNVEIEKAFEEAFAADSRLGKELEVEGTIRGIYDDWKKMSDADILDGLADIIDRSIDLVAAVGDSSNLILDPDLDSYYLMDGVINKIPFATEKLAQIRDAGSDYLLGKSMTEEQRDQLLSLTALLNYSANDIGNGMKVVMEQNPALGTALEASRAELAEEITKFNEVVNKEFLNAATPRLSINDFSEMSGEMLQHHSELYQLELNLLDGLIKDRIDAYESKALVFNIAVAIGIVILLYIFIGFYMSVKKSITYINTSLIQVSQGDLTNNLVPYTKDEVGDIVKPINTVISEFKRMVGASKTASDKVTLSSSELTNAIMQSVGEMDNINSKMVELSSGTQTQYVNSDESSKAMNEIAVHIQHIAETAQDVLNESSNSHQQAIEGKLVMDGAFNQMNKINDSVKNSSELVQFLTSQSEQVQGMVDAIANISARTNILAFNASIEAARAGEQGRGFAVVAAEIQKLAAQSRASTDDISEKLEAIASRIERLGVSMNNEKNEADKGIEAIHHANDIFTEILGSSQRLVDRVQEVTALAEQISSSAEQVTASVHEVADIAKQSAEKTNYASESMTKQAKLMKALLDSADELLQMTRISKEQLSHYKM